MIAKKDMFRVGVVRRVVLKLGAFLHHDGVVDENVPSDCLDFGRSLAY